MLSGGYIVMINETQWYQLPVEGAFKRLDVGSGGLTTIEALGHLKKFGPNELKFRKPSTSVP